MPSKSKAQHNLMEAVAHNPAFAKKVGIPQKVGEDFATADKGRKFSKGGDMKAKMSMKAFEKSSKDVEKKGVKEGSKKDMMMDKGMMGYKKGGKVGCYSKGGGTPSTVQVRGMGAARGRVAKIR